MILACDPGLTGAFAGWQREPELLQVTDMPVFRRVTAKGTRGAVDEIAVLHFMHGLGQDGGATLWIEQVGGVPGQSGPAAFNFGYGVGVVRTAALAAGIAIREVSPVVWKRQMRVPSGPKKSKAVRALASDLLPAWAHLWPLEKHDGRAEAALLALWAEKYG